MKESDVLNVMREALYEFPVLEVNVNFPSWVMVLHENHWLRESYQEAVKETVKDIKRFEMSIELCTILVRFEFIDRAGLAGIEMGQGVAEIDLFAPDD